MSELGPVGRPAEGGGSRGGHAFPASRACPLCGALATIGHGHAAAWRLRNERHLNDAERIALVSEAVGDLAAEEGTSAAEMTLRAAESFVLAVTWGDDR